MTATGLWAKLTATTTMRLKKINNFRFFGVVYKLRPSKNGIFILVKGKTTGYAPDAYRRMG